MKKKILVMCMCVCAVVMVACGKKEVATEVEEIDSEADAVVEQKEEATVTDEEPGDEMGEKEIELNEEEEKGPDFYLFGSKYNVSDSSHEMGRIIELYAPEGYYINVRSRGTGMDIMGENDVSAVDFKGVKNGENKNVTLEVGLEGGTMATLKRCIKLFLGTGEYEDFLARNTFNVQQEICPNFMEKKELVETVYGNAWIIYMQGKGCDMRREGADLEQSFEFALIPVDGYDIYFKCAYGEVTEYKGILKEVMGQMMPEKMQGANENRTEIAYGDYDCILTPDSTSGAIFGFNVPKGYEVDDFINNEFEETLIGENESIYIQVTDREYYPEIFNFIETGTYEEIGEDSQVITMENCGTVETIYGTGHVIYESSLWDHGGQYASECAVLRANGYDIIITCSYKEMSEYRGVLEELLPVMTEKRTN